MNEILTHDRHATVERILKTDFPTDLLESLLQQDAVVLSVQAQYGGEADDDVPTELLKALLQAGIAVNEQFRKAWVAYVTEDEDEDIQAETD